jgi:hypothetical protein
MDAIVCGVLCSGEEAMTKGALSAALAICVLASAGKARAQSAQDKAAAEVLFEDGKDLMRQKKFGLACPKFAESNRLDTGLGTMLWLADCYDKNGQSASAWGEFREAMDIAARTHDAREKVARDRANRLEPTLSRMAIVVGPGSMASGMVVKRDGVEVGQTLWGEAVPGDPGSHTITVTAPKKRPWETSVLVLRGVKKLDVTVPPLEDLPVSATPPPLPPYTPGDDTGQNPPPPPPRSTSNGTVQRVTGGIIGGLGVAGIGAGVGLYLYANQQVTNSDAKGNKCTGGGFDTQGCVPGAAADRVHAQNATTGEIISFVGGGVLILTGVVLIVVAPSGSRSSARLEPWFGPGGGGMSLKGEW